MNFTKLTCATGLLLVTIVSTGSLGDGLAIRNAGLVVDDVKLVVVLKQPLQRAEVELTLSVNNNLTELFRLLDDPRRILLVQTVAGCHHLLGVGLVLRTDSTGILVVGIDNEVEQVVGILAVEGVACLDVLQFDGAAYIACLQFVNQLTIVATSRSKKLGNTFLRTT